MKVILREDVDNLGKVGDVVEVKPGYARNYLIPREKAVQATQGNINRIEHDKKVILARQAKLKASASALARRLAEVEIRIARKVGDQEKLYGSVTALDVAEALAGLSLQIDRRQIQMDEPIKALGDFDVPVKLHSEVVQTVKLHVVAEA